MDRIAKLRAFLLENPGDSFLKHALALECIKAGDDVEARQLFESILENDDNYIGSYYHLCQLLVRNRQTDKAIEWYKKGMMKAKEIGDRHAFNELFMAYEDLIEE